MRGSQAALEFAAIEVVLTFSRASAFSVRISSFVHGRNFVAFLAISVLHTQLMPTNHRQLYAR
jgi:hypothetical protein